MTRSEYLALKVMEEASELAKEISKCTIFGPATPSPYNSNPNIHNVATEFSDLVTVYIMYMEELGLNVDMLEQVKAEKIERVDYYYERLSGLAKKGTDPIYGK